MRAKEFIIETINPDILDPRFTHTQEIGDYTYKAFAYEGRPGVQFLRVQAFDGSPEIINRVGDILFRVNDSLRGGHLESINTYVADEYQKRGIASTMYAYAKMLGNDIMPSKDQLPPGKAMWASWEKSGDAEHLMKEEELSELFDPKTSFPLEWDEQFASQGEVHAEAYDADGRVIHISFTPFENKEVTEVVFTRGGTHEMTGKGDAARVMTTVLNAINIFIEKYKPPYLVFSAKSSGGRASAYAAMIKRAARGYKLLQPNQYPAALNDFTEFIGTDLPFVLART